MGLFSKQRRGFAVMDPELVAEISRKGGISAHQMGRAHEWTPEEAQAAGRLGGLASHAAARRRKREQERQAEAIVKREENDE